MIFCLFLGGIFCLEGPRKDKDDVKRERERERDLYDADPPCVRQGLGPGPEHQHHRPGQTAGAGLPGHHCLS